MPKTQKLNKALFDYIKASPTPYHAVAHTAKMLDDAGFLPLRESDEWRVEAGRGYYVVRGGSSLIAFRMPECAEWNGFMMAAAHCDSPCFRIKENAELAEEKYVRLSAEEYGGMLCASWMDRPLSVAGRVTVRTAKGMDVRLVDLREPSAIIPNVAIHMNRDANSGMKYNAAVDMLPLYGLGGAKGTFRAKAAKAAGVKPDDILTADLMVYNTDAGVEWGDFISAPRLDDLQCAFGALTAFIGAKAGKSVQVYCLFDNEEVGSRTKQGAASTFLYDVLTRVNAADGGNGETYRRRVAGSFLLSCDNAHAVHPNHPEYKDKNHAVYMNEGIVIKYNASQKYTSDAVSAGLFRLICERTGVPCQNYANRADMAGGSTLGNIANTQVSLNTVDIGLAQLAMHSAFETAGAKDTEHLITALTAFYGESLRETENGYEL